MASLKKLPTMALFWQGAVLVCLCLLSLQVQAQEPTEVMAQVQSKYDRAGGFKAWFRQETRQKGMTQGDRAEGWMYFQKPSRMRWQYETPPDQKKEVVADGHQVWIYLPEDAVVMIYPLDQVLRSDLVMRFFSGIAQVRREFTISFLRPPAPGAAYVLKLVPQKPQAELQHLILTINPQTYLVENLEFTNAMGEETRFAFSRLSLDLKVAPDFFTFKTPPGVREVREGPKSR